MRRPCARSHLNLALRCIQAGLQLPAGNLQDLWEQGHKGNSKGKGAWTLRFPRGPQVALYPAWQSSVGTGSSSSGGHQHQGPQMTFAQPIKGMDKGKGKD